MMEVIPTDFRDWVAKAAPSDPEIFEGGRIDVIVFGRDVDDEPSAIIELKLDAARLGNLGSITNDIERRSGLLSVCKPN
jgi:hypothetical protein